MRYLEDIEGLLFAKEGFLAHLKKWTLDELLSVAKIYSVDYRVG